jgi:hypothetical protein
VARTPVIFSLIACATADQLAVSTIGPSGSDHASLARSRTSAGISSRLSTNAYSNASKTISPSRA